MSLTHRMLVDLRSFASELLSYREAARPLIPLEAEPSALEGYPMVSKHMERLASDLDGAASRYLTARGYAVTPHKEP